MAIRTCLPGRYALNVIFIILKGIRVLTIEIDKVYTVIIIQRQCFPYLTI